MAIKCPYCGFTGEIADFKPIKILEIQVLHCDDARVP
jgi:hypothetical protein